MKQYRSYEEAYNRSPTDPDGFWAEAAAVGYPKS